MNNKTLKKAQALVRAFCADHHASLAEVSQLLMIDASNMSLFMDAKSGYASYVNTILSELKGKHKKANAEKLQALRKSKVMGEAPKRAQVDVATPASQPCNPAKEAIAAIDAFKAQYGIAADDKASVALGYSASYVYQARKLCAAHKMGLAASQKLLARIHDYEPPQSEDGFEAAPKMGTEKQADVPKTGTKPPDFDAIFEEKTGYTLQEIKACANEIDMILSAKRLGATVRVTTELQHG